MKMQGAHRMYRHFFTDAISESIAKGGGLGVSNILQQQLNQKFFQLVLLILIYPRKVKLIDGSIHWQSKHKPLL